MIKVSLVVAFYKQEAFVSDVLDGCWNQDYENLEIVIADDASPDATWARIEEYVATHPTRHTVRLHRHAQNVGMMGNYQWLYEQATGDLIVQNDGDDISFPWRCSTLAHAYEKACAQGHAVSIICSHWIDFEGTPPPVPQRPVTFPRWDIYDYKSDLTTFQPWGCLLGACLAFPKKTLDYFGAFNVGILEEDILLTFRSKLIGVRLAIYTPLLHYRIIGGSKKVKSRVFAHKILACSQQLLADLEKAKTILSSDVYRYCKNYLESRIAVERKLVAYVDSPFYLKGLRLFRFLASRPPIREAYIGVIFPEKWITLAYWLKRHNIVCTFIHFWNKR